MSSLISAVVFDVGRVIVQWDLRCLFVKLINDPAELDWFLANVVTEQWHFQHDAGRPLAEMVPERIAEFPSYASQIEAYTTRFNETAQADGLWGNGPRQYVMQFFAVRTGHEAFGSFERPGFAGGKFDIALTYRGPAP